jgi:hypothetical protein
MNRDMRPNLKLIVICEPANLDKDKELQPHCLNSKEWRAQ